MKLSETSSSSGTPATFQVVGSRQWLRGFTLAESSLGWRWSGGSLGQRNEGLGGQGKPGVPSPFGFRCKATGATTVEQRADVRGACSHRDIAACPCGDELMYGIGSIRDPPLSTIPHALPWCTSPSAYQIGLVHFCSFFLKQF